MQQCRVTDSKNVLSLVADQEWIQSTNSERLSVVDELSFHAHLVFQAQLVRRNSNGLLRFSHVDIVGSTVLGVLLCASRWYIVSFYQIVSATNKDLHIVSINSRVVRAWDIDRKYTCVRRLYQLCFDFVIWIWICTSQGFESHSAIWLAFPPFNTFLFPIVDILSH